ncbi:hypothetical protein J2X87_005630 [Pseudomonas synxantha]|uniref:Uncharacterized protein n=1 Tax=Pseudomonas synxantha TaxID=47883 RepID=A0ACC6JVV3_9PSED|nr:hypothetical protein [Pseudomonas synxantha]
MWASRLTEKPSLCLALAGSVFFFVARGLSERRSAPLHFSHRRLLGLLLNPTEACPPRHRFLASDGTQILVLRLNSMLFFKEFI